MDKKITTYSYIKYIKKKFEISLITCKFQLINSVTYYKKQNNRIIQILKQLLKNDKIYETNMINIVQQEIEQYLLFLNDIGKTFKNCKSLDGIKNKHVIIFEKQTSLLNHLIEIFQNPNKMPSFIILNNKG